MLDDKELEKNLISLQSNCALEMEFESET